MESSTGGLLFSSSGVDQRDYKGLSIVSGQDQSDLWLFFFFFRMELFVLGVQFNSYTTLGNS